MRLDVFMVQKNYVSSRAKAQELITSGRVMVSFPSLGAPIKVVRPSYNISDVENTKIIVEDEGTLKYVSRAGVKLEGALDKIKLEVKDLKVVDIGQSTGGFTDCLLQRGVFEIVGMDVGQGQLHEKIKSSPKVTYFEKINARDIPGLSEWSQYKEAFDLMVMDVSFISMIKILDTALFLLKPKGILLSLVKPQFELTRDHLNKKGVVSDESYYKDVYNNVSEALKLKNFALLDYFESSIKGGDGNKEFFVYAKKSN